MKKALLLILALALGLSLLASCGQTDSPTGGSQPGNTQPGEPQAQHLNTCINAELSTLDCARFLALRDRVILHSITEPLTRIQDGVVTAAGAESWEVSEDGLVYTFHLRENHWQDGQQVSAEDYAYALQRQADPANAWSFASDFFSIENFESVYAGIQLPGQHFRQRENPPGILPGP